MAAGSAAVVSCAAMPAGRSANRSEIVAGTAPVRTDLTPRYRSTATARVDSSRT